MVPTFRWTEPPSPCRYLPDHISQFEYLSVRAIEAGEYLELLRAGWRRFGRTLFRQTCSGPGACRALRVDALRFRPDRSQRRRATAIKGRLVSASARPGSVGNGLPCLNGSTQSVPKPGDGRRMIPTTSPSLPRVSSTIRCQRRNGAITLTRSWSGSVMWM